MKGRKMQAQDMQREVKEKGLKAFNEALVAGTSGNVSVYDHTAEIMAITPSNLDYRLMRAEDVVLMKLDGEIVQGSRKPSSEWPMHAAIYAQREDVAAIVHTHSPYATAFALLQEEIPLVLVEILPFIGGEIPLAAFALPGSRELGQSALKALEKRKACLLANHGVVAVGENLDQAYIRAVYVEDAAKIYHLARQLGRPKLISDEAIRILAEKYQLKR